MTPAREIIRKYRRENFKAIMKMATRNDKEVLDIWVVYYNPIEFPGLYVARRHELGWGQSSPTNERKTSETLEGIRSQLPPGLTVVPRCELDAPTIVESWA